LNKTRFSAELLSMNRTFPLALLVFCVALAGCQHKSAVSGTVNYNGAPVEIGYMTLSPLSKGHSFSTPVANGHYKIDDILPGRYTAVAIGTRKINHYSTSAEAYANAGKDAGHVSETADYIAQDAPGNSKEVEVVDGEQTLDLSITGPPPPEAHK
jgi:hypothetical protein